MYIQDFATVSIIENDLQVTSEACDCLLDLQERSLH